MTFGKLLGYSEKKTDLVIGGGIDLPANVPLGGKIDYGHNKKSHVSFLFINIIINYFSYISFQAFLCDKIKL